MIFIGSVDRRKFFCSNDNLLTSQDNPTIQCQIQGPIYHYFILSFLGWYMCDIFNIIFVLLYPMKSVKFFANSVKIHILQSIICWGLPALIIAIVLAATRRYTHLSFPILCFPNEYGLAFTFYIPGVVYSLTTGTGLILLGLTLYKRQKKMANSTSTTNVYQSLLKQMTIYSIALSVLIFIILVQFTYSSINYKITEAYQAAYNWCITAFYENPNCCFPSYEAYYAPFLTLLNEATFCCWGIVALSIVWVREAREVWINILTCSVCRNKYKDYNRKTMLTGVSNNK
ncbi:hypothetical protein LOD99_13515 [Oopsacas minuta]|uniref:G-protein coupled receptors family 2 profile 2 domain-containing protein n=1 Tax=Oopsacas minuta TaxID=111878 RepID=A0AAV7KJT5_9METZ|nr:hypothetical protein LOD99_13515 [Oopsacas minuta]